MEKEKQESTAPWWQPGLVLFYRLSGWIAGPVIFALFIGRWLDKKYKTEPWLFLICIGFAFIISTVGITKDAIREMKRIESKDEEKRKNAILKK